MLHISNFAVGVANGSELMFSDYQTGGPMWAGEGPREARIKIDFPEAFADCPRIMVSLSMWDIESSANQRANIQAENVTTTSFDLVFRSWADTKVARVRAEWIAIGPLPHPEVWDV